MTGVIITLLDVNEKRFLAWQRCEFIKSIGTFRYEAFYIKYQILLKPWPPDPNTPKASQDLPNHYRKP